MHTLFLSKLLLRLYKIDSSPRSLVPSCGRIFRRFFSSYHSAFLLFFETWLYLCVGWALHCKSIHNSNQQRDDEEERTPPPQDISFKVSQAFIMKQADSGRCHELHLSSKMNFSFPFDLENYCCCSLHDLDPKNRKAPFGRHFLSLFSYYFCLEQCYLLNKKFSEQALKFYQRKQS